MTDLLVSNASPKSSSAVRMLELAALTDDLRGVIPPGARVGYIDYPMHINVGDLLIYLGAMDFFAANGNRIVSSFCIFDANTSAYDSLEACDVIVCHGGGNFGDIYPRHQRLREEAVRRYPHKPVVVMPQSFHFGSETAMRDSAAVFRRHDNVTIAVRDLPSRDTARKHFTDRVVLLPDMAHRLYDRFAPQRGARGTRPLQLMRRDAEATDATVDAGRDACDWNDLLPFTEKARIGRHRAASQAAGRLGLHFPSILFQHHATVDRVIGDLASRLSARNPWVTSRLHGAIFGLLLGRDVTLHDNSYGKNSRYFTQWGAGLDTLRLR